VVELGDLMEMAGSLRDVLPIEILPDDDRLELVKQMHVRRFRAGEVIYHDGDPAGDAYVIHSGLVKVLLLNENGHEAIVDLLGRGEFFGELALFQEGRRDNSVVAVIPTTVFQLSRESCWRVLERNPKARDYMFRHLTETIRALSDKYETVVFLDVPGRLAKYLVELGHTGGRLPITQDDLAAAIGSTRVTVNKVLADFERRGLISVDRRKVQILDDAKLRREIRP
jgi:CRP/FNR family cyclic AMP-dependent transcriptional regulator